MRARSGGARGKSEGARRGAGGARRKGGTGQRREEEAAAAAAAGGAECVRIARHSKKKTFQKQTNKKHLLNTRFVESAMNTHTHIHGQKDIKRQKQHKQTKNKMGFASILI